MSTYQTLWQKLVLAVLTLLLVVSILVTACGGKEKATQAPGPLTTPTVTVPTLTLTETPTPPTLSPTPTPTPTATPTATATANDPFLKVLPSLVKVTAQTSEGTVEGTGFIVDGNKGYILTATHVVANAYSDSIKITLRNGVSQLATSVAQWSAADITMLRTEAVDIPAISFGYQATLGQELSAIGIVGDSYTNTAGLVKEIQKDNAGWIIVTIEAQAEPGMSGGPVVDQYGNGIGILSLGSVGGDENTTIAIALSKEDVDVIIAFAEAQKTATPTPWPTPKPTTNQMPPCRFQGTVQLNGSNVPDGTVITVTVAGDIYSTTTIASKYSIDIYQLEDMSYNGQIATFKIGSYTAAQTATWQYGLVKVNLSTTKPTTMQMPPCRFQGTVQLNSYNVPDGTVITVTIAGDTYITTTVNSTYRIDIYNLVDESYAGKATTFKIGSYTAAQTAIWQYGLVKLNLSNG